MKKRKINFRLCCIAYINEAIDSQLGFLPQSARTIWIAS